MSQYRLAFIVALGALVGCTHPATFDAIAPTPRVTVYDCVNRAMSRLNYQVSIPDPDTHVTVGDRAGAQHGLSAMGNVIHDRLMATVTTRDTVSARLNIVASSVKVVTFANASRIQKTKTTDTVQVDALIVMRACASTMPKGAP
jgi:hypothetical protein